MYFTFPKKRVIDGYRPESLNNIRDHSTAVEPAATQNSLNGACVHCPDICMLKTERDHCTRAQWFYNSCRRSRIGRDACAHVCAIHVPSSKEWWHCLWCSRCVWGNLNPTGLSAPHSPSTGCPRQKIRRIGVQITLGKRGECSTCLPAVCPRCVQWLACACVRCGVQ